MCEEKFIGGEVLWHVNPLLGNAHNTHKVQHSTRDEAVFYVIRSMPSAGNGPMN